MVNESRTGEKDIIGPVLEIIAEKGERRRGLGVTDITNELRKRLKLSNADLAILKGRKDDHFSQVVRNLVSHRTLEKTGYAEYRRGGLYGKGAYVLTPKGRAKFGEPNGRQADLFE